MTAPMAPDADIINGLKLIRDHFAVEGGDGGDERRREVMNVAIERLSASATATAIWLQIDKGVPVPKPNPGGRNWENRNEAKIPWKQLEPGDSVFVTGCQGSRGAQLVKSANERRTDARFIGRTVVGGYRIWRIT